MKSVEWVPGEGRALVRPGALMLSGEGVDHADIVAIWHRLDSLDGVEGLGILLDVLSEVTGRGLRSLPDFALAVLDEKGLHVAVRGGFDATVTSRDGDGDVVRGRDVTTWAERNFDPAAVDSVTLNGPGDVPYADALPIVAGVVPASAVRLALTNGDGTSSVVSTPRQDGSAAGPAVVLATPVTLAETEVEEVEVEEARSDVELAVEDPEVVEAVEAAEGPVEGTGGRFASLLSPHTVMHDIEEAAVRPVEGDEEHPAPPGEAAVVAPEEVAEPVEPAQADPVSPPREVEPAAAPSPPSPPSSSFISAVPVSGSAPHPAPRPTVPEPTHDGGAEHHDGHTQLALPDSSALDAYREQPPAGGNEMVLGVMCPAGHGNPTHRTECRVCGARLTGDSVQMPRPGLGWLHTSAGEAVELVQNVLVGRDPRASRIQGTTMPRLLPMPHSHVSGTHLEIRLEGWSVLVADLRSTNGTFLQRTGQSTVRLSEAPQLLASSDVIHLGHGVELRFEALP